MRFTKPPLSINEQLDQLAERGMEIGDRAAARHYLRHLNYYRLGAYWLPFEEDHLRHKFKPGTRFQDVLDLYVFDRELRLLILDAIERVEVSIRTQWAYHMACHHGPHAHLNPALFKANGRWSYQRLIIQICEDVKASHETFIRLLTEKYDETLPPIWALVEVMSLGQLSKWYANTRHRDDRNRVAHEYGFDEANLTSFLHHLAVVRNICAHHGRLWNRHLTFEFKLPRKRPAKLIPSLNNTNRRNIYNTLAVLVYLLDIVSPGHRWRERFLNLIQSYRIDLALMGFPSDWRNRRLWVWQMK